MGQDLRLKRKAIEAGQLERLLGQGRGQVHLENLAGAHTALRAVLWALRLRERGERNALAHVIREIVFVFPNLPRAFDGFRALHLSDIHADCLSGFADALSSRLKGLSADLCVLTGDYRFATYGPSENACRFMETILSNVESRLGVVGILGNHDFAEMGSRLEEMGVRMLVNRSLEIEDRGESIWIAGVDDPHYYGCDDLPAALAGVPESAFKILLAHSPEICREAAASGVDLYLCGHTHGGQIRLPVIGAFMLNANCPRGLARGGEWRYEGMPGYTSAGAGSSCAPVRFNCPPEIAVIELRRGR